MRSVRVLLVLLRTIRADRALGPAADRDGRPLKGCIETARIRGLRGSPFTQYPTWALIERITAFTPCDGLLDVDCGEGLLTRYLTGVAKQIVGIDLSPTAIGHSAHRE